MKKITYNEATAKRIQNFGEQDPRFHDAEMTRWRARWNKRAKLTDALNRIDEHACDADAVRNNDNGEAEQLEKDYNLVFDALQKL